MRLLKNDCPLGSVNDCKAATSLSSVVYKDGFQLCPNVDPTLESALFSGVIFTHLWAQHYNFAARLKGHGSITLPTNACHPLVFRQARWFVSDESPIVTKPTRRRPSGILNRVTAIQRSRLNIDGSFLPARRNFRHLVISVPS